MADPFLGEIRLFAGNFPPKNWAFCDGQVLTIGQNTSLFALLGNTYGGDGATTFALPDLRSRVPVGSGQGPGLSERNLGETGGSATVALTPAQLPAHSHQATNSPGTTNRPAGAVPAAGGRYTSSPPNVPAATAHENRPPYLGITYIICLVGNFPQRP